MTSDPYEPLDIAGGNVGLSLHLESSLRRIAASAADENVKRLIAEVLARRMSVRELAVTDAFNTLMMPVMRTFAQNYKQPDSETLRQHAADMELRLAEGG
ncbi:hypothetical protein [Hoyosella subflava]|uniref:Uncharacterized protein n=1 Tax=Hoyosella subflava (strain DSM 45089 / JCM 17490 / NBRC 109087 / DQS3-9A1) TaxID=443218 RepID=F6EI62_HOYSD|nr:hypothetical protein [Hoyosella subflava]AEF41169.1 hypothetical protein AS9A_2722 [Hoyosella subflava DQS3-9A1]